MVVVPRQFAARVGRVVTLGRSGSMQRSAWRWIGGGLASLAVVLTGTWVARACPFCSATQATLREEIAQADVAVLAELVKPAEMPKTLEPGAPGELPMVALAEFKILEVLRGNDIVGTSNKIGVRFFGRPEKGTQFLVIGVDGGGLAGTKAAVPIPLDRVIWNRPIQLTPRSATYVKTSLKLPEKGAERLAFFQHYLESDEELLSLDAYTEFAIAPYAEVQALKPQMQRETLLKWVKDPEVSNSHRRLYLTMLGVCGTKADLPLLEGMLRQPEPHTKLSLDALVGCYLTLAGEAGVPLVEELYLNNPKAEYTHIYSAVMAMRFLIQEGHIIPKARLLTSLRYLLDRPDLADLVISDLARGEDWEVLPRLTALFKNADPKTNFVRTPIINFLQACPRPEAKAILEEFKQLDPDAFERASFFNPFVKEATPTNGSPAAGTPGKTEAGKTTPTGSAANTDPNVPRPTMPTGDDESAPHAQPASFGSAQLQSMFPTRMATSTVASSNAASSTTDTSHAPDNDPAACESCASGSAYTCPICQWFSQQDATLLGMIGTVVLLTGYRFYHRRQVAALETEPSQDEPRTDDDAR